MKLTKQKLKQIIKEELEEVAGVGLSDRSADPEFGNHPEDLKRKAEASKGNLGTSMAYIMDLHKGIGEIADKHGGQAAIDIYDALRNATSDHYSRAMMAVQEVGKEHGGDIDEDIYYFFEEFDS